MYVSPRGRLRVLRVCRQCEWYDLPLLLLRELSTDLGRSRELGCSWLHGGGAILRENHFIFAITPPASFRSGPTAVLPPLRTRPS
jgi:hypothetical protein